MSELRHLPATASVEAVIDVIREDGCVVIDELAPDIVERAIAELEPYIGATRMGSAEYDQLTRRTGRLVERSPAARELIMHPTVLGASKAALDQATVVQYHVGQVITLSPGAPAQFVHRDPMAFDNFPFPPDYEVMIAAMWAGSRFTEEMGATRVVPKSQHLGNDVRFTVEETVPAEMEQGSVLLYTGRTYHGGGANTTTDKVRYGLVNAYSAGWVRQEENQYLSCRQEVARTLDDDLLRLMGYQVGSTYGIGFVGDMDDALAALRELDSVPAQINYEQVEELAR
jgi:ectoine hydroxylase-related dioxygenase (phytanoyl-CoA dioxygenase family)